ncbi:hypothetical protein [Streptomyces sp. H39-S7]|uniref:hypothetical protein n=1 Tax=Streptomyces sp. H39-S7 TaxID=3004357 RepID=UPI0022AF89C4|nr:hypothetical protein [Streptomyces sp. H39-S7]MCZ4124648.1 hypothetical protein [Streptomyces sp. H39-S7]
MTFYQRRRASASAAMLLLSVLALAACSSDSDKPATPIAASTAAGVPTTPTATNSPAQETAGPGTTSPPSQVEMVRDAFAGLQATLNDSCTPGNCAYFLGRVNDELTGLEAAMKADPQGPGHFADPLAWTSRLWDTVGPDRSFANLKRHQTLLLATRGKINTWMQGHPEDYR